MKERRHTTLSLPEIELLAGTRVLLGAGLGLLLSERLGIDQKKTIGWTLVLVGVMTTLPFAFQLYGGRRLPQLGPLSIDQERTGGAVRQTV